MGLRNFNPNDEWCLNELKKLNAKDWQVNCLLKNPDYTC